MSEPTAMLATLLRGAQWKLDEAAFHIGARRFSQNQCVVLADGLTELATALRQYAEQAPDVIGPE